VSSGGRAPLRIPLAGGGTDLPAYYRRHGGYFISAAIGRSVSVRVGEPAPGPRWRTVPNTGALADFLASWAPRTARAAIYSSSEIAPGSGLGSSGAFATALLVAARTAEFDSVDRAALAEAAFQLEVSALTPDAGRQDTLVAAHGGLREYELSADGIVVQELAMPADARRRFAEQCLLVDTGIQRRATTLLADQNERLTAGDAVMEANLHRIRELAFIARDQLIRGDLDGYATLMHEHWLTKRQRSPGMTNPAIDGLYELGLRAGVVGGKLVGAGGGGYLLMYSTDPDRTLAAYQAVGRQCMRIGIDDKGAQPL
jgi:D-glycero-alpha-D-manno-heptose-7-phosphate kinase